MIMIDPIKPLAEGFMTEPASVLMDFFFVNATEIVYQF